MSNIIKYDFHLACCPCHEGDGAYIQAGEGQPPAPLPQMQSQIEGGENCRYGSPRRVSVYFTSSLTTGAADKGLC